MAKGAGESSVAPFAGNTFALRLAHCAYPCKYMYTVTPTRKLLSGWQHPHSHLCLGAGSTQEGLANLYCDTASEPLPKTDALTELDSTFALNSSEPEADAQVASAPAPTPAAAHHSTACHRQIQTAVNRMWDMAANDDEMQQHLLSQVNIWKASSHPSKAQLIQWVH